MATELDPTNPQTLLASYKEAKAELPPIDIPEAPGAMGGGFANGIAKTIENTPPDEWLEKSLESIQEGREYVEDKLKEWMEDLEDEIEEMFKPILDSISDKIAEMAVVEESEKDKKSAIASAEASQVAADKAALDFGPDSVGGVPKGVFNAWVTATQANRQAKQAATEADDMVKTTYLLKAKAQYVQTQSQLASAATTIGNAVKKKVELITKLIAAIKQLPVVSQVSSTAMGGGGGMPMGGGVFPV